MLIKNSAIFAGTTLVKGLCAFLVIAVYTRMLSPAEYGSYIIFLSVILFVDAFAFQSVRHCLIRNVTSDERKGDAAYLDNAILLYACLGIISILMPFILMSAGFDTSLENKIVFGLLGVLMLFEALSNYVIDLSRIRNSYKIFVIVNLAKPVISLMVGAYLIYSGWGMQGAIYGMLAGTALSSLYGVFSMKDIRLWVWPSFDPSIIKGMFAFGAPLALTFFIQSGMSLSNRFMLEGFVGSDVVGLYTAAQEIPTKLLNLIIIGVHIAAYPLAVRALENGGQDACREQLKDNVTLMLGVALPSIVGMVLLKPYLANIFVGEEFRPFMLQYFVFFAVLAFMNAIIQYYLLLAFNLSKQTHKLILPFFVGFCLMVGLGFYAIPAHEADGAIFAAFSAYSVLFLILIISGRRVFPLPFPLMNVAKLIVATAIMAGVLIGLKTFQNSYENPLLFILDVVLGGSAYVIAVLLLNVSDAQTHVKRILRRAS